MRAFFTLVISALMLAVASADAIAQRATTHPVEDTEIVLHNPDMGWVLYENYPLDQRPGGSGTLNNLPDEDFPDADAVALMFAWSDIEKSPGKFDFSQVDTAYDYWAKRGKAIELRMSTESLVWWNTQTPPSGEGVPKHVLAEMPENTKQVREMTGIAYTVVDAREPNYLKSLDRFLAAVNDHFDDKRPVTLIDLRGFGVWGEWHSGYKYATADDRHAALSGVIDHWSKAFPNNWITLSFSYDPDSPKELFEGPYKQYDEKFTRAYDAFVRYSAYDHAMTKHNVSWRRDGAGGAVHSNERKFCEAAFATMQHGPFMSEFCGGYIETNKGGEAWQKWMIDDALSLHPNYINLLGWQASDALAFCKERPDWVAHGAREMGYRLFPTSVAIPGSAKAGGTIRVDSTWVNRGVGRAQRAFSLEISLVAKDGTRRALSGGTLATDKWVKGNEYVGKNTVKVPSDVSPGTYDVRLSLRDLKSGRVIALPVKGCDAEESSRIGSIDLN